MLGEFSEDAGTMHWWPRADRGGTGPWIRPVSDRPTEDVSEEERRYEDGKDPRVLDIIDMPLIETRPKDYQQENWLLNPNFYWEKRGIFAWADLA